jgi:hypothetical protein
MANTASGKHAKAISDRSGMEFPYREMVTEWNGAFVHTSEFEDKQPQLESRSHGGDGIALPGQIRPARTEFATPIVLMDNPFTTSSSSTSVVVSTSNNSQGIDTNPFQTSDAIRFTKVKSSSGSVVPSIFELETTLNETLTDSDTTITLSDATNFPTSGYMVIEKVLTSSDTTNVLLQGTIADETIKYTGKSGNNLTGCTRGTSAPVAGVTPTATTARTHNSGAKVFGSYIVTRTTSSVTNNGITLSYSYSFTFSLASSATTGGTGGGNFVFAGPVNQRA